MESAGEAPKQREDFHPRSLEEVLEIARKCHASSSKARQSSKELLGCQEVLDYGSSEHDTWEQALKWEHLLNLAAKPDFVPPSCFQPAMETCVACLLHTPKGQLMQPARMLQLQLGSIAWTPFQPFL